MSTLSKIQVVFHPALPATCAVCRKSADGNTRFMDFQADLDYYGAILLCEDCAKEMLTLLKFVPVTEVEERNAQIEFLHTRVQETQAENERLNSALDAILRVRPDLSDAVHQSDSVDDEATPSGNSKSKSK